MIRRARKGIVLIFFIAVLVSAGIAQQTLKIAVVNSQEVLEKSTEGKKVMAQLQSKDSKASADIAKMDEDIRILETRLNTQRLTLTQESMIQMQADLERKRTERVRYAEDMSREIQELQQRLYVRIQSELLPIIEAVGKERNLDVIFDLTQSGAIYFNPTINLTAEIILRYDASKASK